MSNVPTHYNVPGQNSVLSGLSLALVSQVILAVWCPSMSPFLLYLEPIEMAAGGSSALVALGVFVSIKHVPYRPNQSLCLS